MKWSGGWDLLRQTTEEWVADKVPQLGAALAYYAVFSLAPLLLIAIGIASQVFGEQAARGEIGRQIEDVVGEPGARAIQEMLEHTHTRGHSRLATLIGVAILFFGASGVVIQLQDALNTIWKVRPKPGRGLWGIVVDRFFSFAVVIAIGFLLLVSLIASAAISAAEKSLSLDSRADGMWFSHGVNSVASFIVFTLLFALMFKVLPDAQIGWRHVWLGAPLTSLLFTAGKYAIGLYLGWSSTASAFGAAGSLVVVLIWVYYSSQILLFGAEFTRVFAGRQGAAIVPKRHAERIPC